MQVGVEWGLLFFCGLDPLRRERCITFSSSSAGLLFPCLCTPVPAHYQLQSKVSMVTFMMCYGGNSFEGGQCLCSRARVGEKALALSKQGRREFAASLVFGLYSISISGNNVSDYSVYHWNTFSLLTIKDYLLKECSTVKGLTVAESGNN